MTIRVYDEKFRRQPGKYLLQSSLATLSIILLVAFRQFVETPALLASLGASCFIAFTMPHMRISSPRHLVGGYLCGAMAGGLCQTLLHSAWMETTGIGFALASTVLAGVAVGVSILLMVILDFEHAPAAGIALGLVLEKPVPANILYMVGAIIILATLKTLFRRWMIDLL